jgi:hypothetical protein
VALGQPSSFNTFVRCFGGHVADPVTRVVGPSTLTLYEYLCSGRDVRSYTVEHRSDHTGRLIRSRVFECASYMGGPGNWCGAIESTQARALLREWQGESWPTRVSNAL